MLDHFAGCFGIRIAYYTPEGQELRAGLRQSMCGYCQMVRGRLGQAELCQKLDHERLAEAAARRCLVAYTCHSGLNEAVQPVLLDGELAGFVMIGQFRTTEQPPAGYDVLCRRHRVDRTSLQRQFAAVPAVSAAALPHVLGLFSMLVETITRERLVSLRGDLCLSRVTRYVQANLQRPVSLEAAARAAGRSRSTVSHLFQRRLGCSFRTYVLNQKLAAAETLLRDIPGLTVAEAAARVGFNSPFQFSRMFSKYRGRPPSRVAARPATS